LDPIAGTPAEVEIMALSEEEKDLVAQSLQLYLQQASMQLPPQSVQQLVAIAKGIISKLDNLEAGGGKPKANGPPPGISQDWFEHVCQTCPNLTATGCSDKITVKFPGKCDPIIKYERAKVGIK
jgi:hypothetical protein